MSSVQDVVCFRITWLLFTLLLPPVFREARAQTGDSLCTPARPPESFTEWNDDTPSSPVNVEWLYGNVTCSSINSCYGLTLLPTDVALEPQLPPVQLQEGRTLRFVASPNMDVAFTMQVYLVSEADFQSCVFTSGQALLGGATSQMFTVLPQYLQLGVNYFIANTSDSLIDCRYGLRLNVTVKSENCARPGETSFCSTRGRCLSHVFEPTFSCYCCEGYDGEFCDNVGACASGPCRNGGTCSDVTAGGFSCTCPDGYGGPTCQLYTADLCQTNPCQNNATCSGNLGNYSCECLPGYRGYHCEVDVDDCSPSPCVHGLCVDKVAGHQCYCRPGYGGSACEREYNECLSNPCQHGGFCFDLENGYECRCPRGYQGNECSIKVDLCDPSPCYSATDCVDHGPDLSCVCKPGFIGVRCEINIDECASSPCRNGGICIDAVAGFVCSCPQGVAGIHCEYRRVDLPRPPSTDTPQKEAVVNPLHISNLSVVAATLAGALILTLLVLAGCYCKVHETYRKVYCCCEWKKGGYIRHRDSERLQEKRLGHIRQMIRQFSPFRPTLVESYTAQDDYPSGLDDPLVGSLRPKVV